MTGDPGPDHRWYVVVSGPPASGKGTLARRLAPALGLPLLAKDTLKDGLLSVLDAPDVATSRLVGRAAVAALLAVAAEAGSCVLESVWHRSRALADGCFGPDLAADRGPGSGQCSSAAASSSLRCASVVRCRP